MTKQEIVKELRTILKTYHYESNEQHISKDVVTSLENMELKQSITLEEQPSQNI